MKYTELLEIIVSVLVNNKEAIEIKEEVEENTIILKFSVDPSDNGKVIGKKGANFKAIKKILSSYARRNSESIELKFEAKTQE